MLSFFQRNTDDVLIRPLTTDDWDELEKMIALDPIKNLYASEHLERFGLPTPSALSGYRHNYGFMGIFLPVYENAPLAQHGVELTYGTSEEDRKPLGGSEKIGHTVKRITGKLVEKITPELLRPIPLPNEILDSAEKGSQEQPATFFTMVGAFWLGSNCVPILIPKEYRKHVSTVIARSLKYIACIIGEAEDALGLWSLLQSKTGTPHSVCENQPLLYLDPQKSLETLTTQKIQPLQVTLDVPPIAENPVRWARTSDRDSLLKASVAMFIEEIGYDPMDRDAIGYAQRVEEYIRTGRSLVATNDDGVVIFKADLGLAYSDLCQIQGVWLHPAYRGVGLSAPLLAQAIELIRPRFPHISLYVNNHNQPAYRLYQSLGMEQYGTFATITF
ncbi:GNAT family N-acetyltransferase [Rothia sp. P7181]|uniref:GNAT family N-acetyltransferase n=1 Tax=Rothia sp. P7181 TaxID=3402663 RepID=UPI003AE7C5D8